MRAPMPKTRTAEQVIDLMIRARGMNEEEFLRVVTRAKQIAHGRHSYRLGLRHLVEAAARLSSEQAGTGSAPDV